MKKLAGMWIKKYQNLKMRNKILVSIYLILFPILLIVTGILYYWNYRNSYQDNLSLYHRFVQNICENIDYMQQDVLDISDYFAVNADVHQILTDKKENYAGSGLFWTENAPLSFVSDILAIKSQIKTTILYPENGLTPYYISRDASVHDTDIEHIRKLPIYEEMIKARGDIVWKRADAGKNDIYLNNKSDKMVAYRMLFDLSKKKRLGVLAIGIETSRYEKICRGVLNDKNEGVVILDGEGRELVCVGEVEPETLEYLHSMKSEDFSGMEEETRLETKKSHVFIGLINKNNLMICYVSPKTNWGAVNQADFMLPFIIMLLLLSISWPLSSAISSSLSRSTKTLLASMEQFKRGDFTQRVEVESQDEIGELSRAFNDMAAETKSLIDRNYVMALKEREIELNALQAQINPHFLYNVLDSLYWEAIDADNEKLGEDILALSDLFRLLLSQGESEITVSREMELISRYLQIQRMRFSRRFSYKIDVEEKMMQYKISKLLLQPFVENAIVHGFERKQEQGYVHISGREKDGRMEFIIEDDGAGMNQEDANRLLEGDMPKDYPNFRIGRYAIRNIKERLTLRYGEDYELRIVSKKGEGTRVYILIPITSLS